MRRPEPRKAFSAHMFRTFSPAIEAIAKERTRQKEAEGYDEKHDDEHSGGALARAAAVYAYMGNANTVYLRDILAKEFWNGKFSILRDLWPWDWDQFKPKNPRYDLVRAAALIVAEIERLDRATPVSAGLDDMGKQNGSEKL